LVEDHTYYWRVQAIDPEGVDSFDGSEHWSPWADTRSFTIAAIDKTVFTAGTSQEKTVGNCSAIFTFEIRNEINESVNLLADKSFSACTGGNEITSITITTGSHAQSFYYQSTTSSIDPYTITVSENPDESWTDAETTIKITPDTLDHFGMTGYPANLTTDQTFAEAGSANVTVTAYDQYNNAKYDYTGEVWFSSTADGYSFPAVLPYTSSSHYTFTGEGGDNGVKDFSGSGFWLKQVGTHTLTLHHSAYDGHSEDDLSVDSSNITVTPGIANNYLLADYPAVNPSYSRYAIASMTWDAGDGLGVPYDVTVTVRDQFNNVKTDYTGKLWFNLFTGSMDPADYTFTYGTEGTAYQFTGAENGVKQFNSTDFLSNTAGKDLVFRVTNGSANTDQEIYIKPLGLDHFTLETSSTMARNSVDWDQDIDEEWDRNDTPVDPIVTAYDTLGNVKVDYAFNDTTKEGMIYFYSDQRATHSEGTPVTNKELPYYKTSATDTSACFQFPEESMGVHTFDGEADIFKFFRGAQR